MEGYVIFVYSGVQGLLWNNLDLVIKDGDIEIVKQILEQVGWKLNSVGIREKNGVLVKIIFWYVSGDIICCDLVQVVCFMFKFIGIEVDLKFGSWEIVEWNMYVNLILFGWGSFDLMELYYYYSSKVVGVEYYNSGYYQNLVVDKYL